MRVVTMPDLEAPARIVFDPEQGFDDDAYFAFCAANPDLRIERTSCGEILIVPPAGAESSYRSGKVHTYLDSWATRTKKGKAFDSSCEFILPSGAGYAPDAAFVSNAKLAQLSKAELRKFPKLVPDFVVEVFSPSDRLPRAKERAQQWIDEGVALAWLIDGDNETVWIYRPGQAPEKRVKIAELAGEGPVDGFVLGLQEIWAGL